jgi:hypothetical protein
MKTSREQLYFRCQDMVRVNSVSEERLVSVEIALLVRELRCHGSSFDRREQMK